MIINPAASSAVGNVPAVAQNKPCARHPYHSKGAVWCYTVTPPARTARIINTERERKLNVQLTNKTSQSLLRSLQEILNSFSILVKLDSSSGLSSTLVHQFYSSQV